MIPIFFTTRTFTLEFLVFTVIALSACDRKLSPEDFRTWISDYDNGLHKRKTVGELFFDVQYKPEALVAYEQKQEGKDSVQEDFLQYYLLTIGMTDQGEDLISFNASQEEQQQRLYYYAYTFQNDIYLEQGDEKLPCLLYHFERSYDLKNTRTFVLAFDRGDMGIKESTIVIDSEFLNTGPVKLLINKTNIPELRP